MSLLIIIIILFPASGQRLEILPSNTVAREGTNTRLLCRVADKAGVQTWLKNGQQLNEDTNVIVADDRWVFPSRLFIVMERHR